MAGSKMEGAHVIEIYESAISDTSKPKPVINKTKADVCLFRKTRRTCNKGDEDVYEPSIISIGPYHHRAKATFEMEKIKWESLSYILDLNPSKKMKDYIKEMAKLEHRIRSCYSNEIDLDGENLLKMLLLDGCFMICNLHGMQGILQEMPDCNMPERIVTMEQNGQDTINNMEVDNSQPTNSYNANHEDNLDDEYYSKQWHPGFFSRDLLLLENQIPFFVLTKIFEIVTDGQIQVSLLMENIAESTEDLIYSYPKATVNFDWQNLPHNLLHLCHMYFMPRQVHVLSNNEGARHQSPSSLPNSGQQLVGWRRATEYQKAGMEIRKTDPSMEKQHSLLDIEFCKGIMQIPRLTIDPNTYCLFRNLIAFEQMACPQFGNYITTYAVFLCHFMRTPADVSILTKEGIIVHHLESDAEVSELFGMLAEDVAFDFNGDYYLKTLYYAMEEHYHIWSSRWGNLLGLITPKIPGWSRDSSPDKSPRMLSPEHCV